MKTLFEEEDDYYKPIRSGSFWNDNNLEYGSNCDKNKNLSIRKYLDEIKPYLKDIIHDIQKFCTCKVQLTNAVKSKKLKMINKCFQYAATIALNYGEIRWKLKRNFKY